MKKIRVNVSTPYDVVIERGILKSCGSLIADITKSRKTVIITDDIVEKLYCDTLENTLAENGFSFSRFVFKNGEASKNSDTLNRIYAFLAENEITRKDIIIALGGGVHPPALRLDDLQLECREQVKIFINRLLVENLAVDVVLFVYLHELTRGYLLVTDGHHGFRFPALG